MAEDGKGLPTKPKQPDEHVVRLHLFDDEDQHRGPLGWLRQRLPTLVMSVIGVGAVLAYVAFRIWPLPPRPLPALEAPVGPETVATEPSRFRAGLTPLPDAALRSPVGSTLSLAVRAVDLDGRPLVGTVVRFAISEGAGRLGSDTASTDDGGLATARLTLPGRPGSVVVAASLPDSPLPGATFTVTALAGSPRRVRVVDGDGQEVTAGELLPRRVAVRVTDDQGVPVPGVEVRFRVLSGDGAVAPAQAETDGAGVATAFWRLGAREGVQRLAALAPEADSDLLTFTATALADATPDSIEQDSIEQDPTEAAGEEETEGEEGAPDSATVVPLLVVPRAFAIGGNFVCALPGGDLTCRGSDDRMQRASRTGAGFVAVAAGLAHACALTADGNASCWGANESGQLGDGTRENRATPRRVATEQTFIRLVAGWSHTCATGVTGETFCWGLNDHGQLGNGSTLDRLTPTPVQGAFRSLVAGSAHTCGIRGDQVLCWGDNRFGQLGDGSTEDRTVPTRVRGLPGAPVGLAAGAVSTCALLDDGSAYCWGQNLHGQLGDGSTSNRVRPTQVVGGHTFRSLFAGGALTCGFADDGLDYCWGLNQSGQLGDGTRVSRSVPTRVGG